MKKLAWLTSIAAVLAAMAPQPAGAAFVLNLTVPNLALAGFPGPYGTATISLLNATTASVLFQGNTVGGFQYLFGDGGSVALNINAGSFTVGPISGSNAGVGFTPGPFTFVGAGVEDGFGSFNLTINDFDGYTHSADQVSFNVTNTSGIWASDADVLTGNATGHKGAAHIFVTTFPANAANGANVTGFASDGEAPVPEPTTLVLLGFGLAGSSGLRLALRRRRK